MTENLLAELSEVVVAGLRGRVSASRNLGRRFGTDRVKESGEDGKSGRGGGTLSCRLRMRSRLAGGLRGLPDK